MLSFHFGEWRLDGELGRLVHDDGTTVAIEPKALELLMALAEQPGRPVSRALLRQRIWKGDHIAPGALKHLVWQLRQDLGDEAKAPRYIETVRGRGYRLLVETSQDRSEEPGDRSRSAIALTAGVTLTLVAALWLFYSLRPVDPGGSVPEGPRARPLTSLPGNELGPAMAPDGSFVAFAWDGGDENGEFDLYRVPASGGAPERLVSGPGDDFEPAVSPDGLRIAYLRGDVRTGGVELRRLDLGTGEDRSVATGRFLDVAWLDADRRLVVSERPTAGAPVRLSVVSTDGSSTPLTEPPAQTAGDFFPAVSPSGDRVAFYRQRRAASGRIMLLELSTRELEPLSAPVGRVAGLTFDPAGTGLIVSSDQVPPRGLWRLPLTDENPSWLGLPGSFVAEPSSSRSGALTYQDQRCESNVWALSVSGSTGEPESRPVASLASTRQDMQASFSPDGRQVAFLSNRGGANRIWLAAWPDGTPAPVPTGGGSVLAFDWSPDGERFAFTIRSEAGHSVVFTARTDGGEESRLSNPELSSITPRWSRDGTAVYYASWIGDEWRVVRQTPADGAKIDLGPGVSAAEGLDDGELWVLDAGAPGLSRRSPDGETEVIVPFLSTADTGSWQPVEGGVVFIHWGQDGTRLLSRWTYLTERVERIATLDKNLPYPAGLSVSPDRATILWTRIDAVGSDLQLAMSPF